MHSIRWIFVLCLGYFMTIEARIHQPVIRDDDRRHIRLTSFGYKEGGFLQIHITGFNVTNPPTTNSSTTQFGFTLEKMGNDAIDSYMITYRDKCLLDDESTLIQYNYNVTFFSMDFKNKIVRVNCGEQSSMAKLHLYNDMPAIKSNNDGLPTDELSPNSQSHLQVPGGKSCSANFILPLVGSSRTGYSTKFVVHMPSSKEEGIYKLQFHSCGNYPNPVVKSSFVADIKELNENRNYLSAGEIPLPTLYYDMSMLFIPWAIFWTYVLVRSNYPVNKIHYLMAVLIILKSLELFCRGINYHYIGTKGIHEATWAYSYYIIHILQESLLFGTIILIGTGWTIIKHSLSPKVKIIFTITIPLKVLTNVAEIIVDQSEESDANREVWQNVFTYVDLTCCFLILIPMWWSIKHLHNVSKADGKTANDLQKLKLFRHFYLLVVSYIYFTRIIAYLLKVSVPFQYDWSNEFLKEITTFVFFLLAGYKFRPAAPDKTYFPVSREGNIGV